MRLREAERERGAVERHRQIAQEKRQRADMVFMAVREYARLDPIGVFAEPGEIGEHEIDARHFRVWKKQAAVDDQDAVVDLEARAVAADLPEPTEERELDGSFRQG